MKTNIYEFIENSACGVVVFNETEVTFSNKMAESLYGIKLGQSISGHLFPYYKPGPLSLAKETLDEDNVAVLHHVTVMTMENEEQVSDVKFQRFSSDTQDIYMEIVPVSQDVLLEKKSKKAGSMRQKFAFMQELSPHILFFADVKKLTIYHCSAEAKILGVPEVMENYPHCFLERLHEDDLDEYLVYAENVLKGTSGDYSARILMPDGEYEWYRIHSHVLLDAHGEPLEVVGRLENVAQDKMMAERATEDILANILDPIEMEEVVNLVLSQSSKHSFHALFLIDLDDFKSVNDNFGENFGDFLLARLGSRLGSTTRIGDLVGRVGGDEFLVFLRDVPSVDVVTRKAKSILAMVSEEITVGTDKYCAQASIGISTYPDHGELYENLYDCAEKGLIHSKTSGKNMSTLYSSETEKK